MNAPLYEVGLFGDTAALLFALGLGVAFGWFLERGGMGNANKLAGQFYFTDLAVFKVMFSAIVTTLLGLYWLSWLGWIELPLVFLPPTYVVPQLLGGVVFGVGFVMGGLCPGTSCVSASTGKTDGFMVVGGMLFGVFAFNELFPLLEGVYRATPMGPVTIPEVIGAPFGVVVFAVVAIAIAGFVGAEKLETYMRARSRGGAG
ncbi:MAG: YeeE/YedE thiosulfate transporter family protein [Gemmatimonadota bacterium]|nr:YeeE/YedE thiosulfate transporter family protein [Gemmatimonadota bacterium]